MRRHRQGFHSVWIGARVRKIRIRRRLEQKRLADILGISQYQLCKYEQGINRIAFEMAIEIVDALEVPLDALRPPQGMLEEARDPLLVGLRMAAADPPVSVDEREVDVAAWGGTRHQEQEHAST